MMKKLVLLLGLAALLVAPLKQAQSKAQKKADEKVVDSGSFGIFKDGHRVATETFRIQQGPEISVTTSEIKTDDGGAQMHQSSELEIGSNGDLHKYEWHGLKPE